MSKVGLLVFVGLVLVAGAITLNAQNSRYAFAYTDHLNYVKLDSRTGKAWYCGAEFDECIPMSNKAEAKAYTDRHDFLEQMKPAGFTDKEIKEWMDKNPSK